MADLGFINIHRFDGLNRRRVPHIMQIIDDYEDQLPLTVRQIFYIMISRRPKLYHKTESEVKSQQLVLKRMRRGGMIPFEAIRDDRFFKDVPLSYDGVDDFYDGVRGDAAGFRLDRQRKQKVFIELWCEAVGMAPSLAKLAAPYGVPVYSGGGFSSVTGKYNSALRMSQRPVQTVVLHIGDHDLHGDSIFSNLGYDLKSFIGGEPRNLGGYIPEVVSIAVTQAQIVQMNLPGMKVKKKDVVQAEAIPPADMARLVKSEIEARMNLDRLAKVLKKEAQLRAELVAWAADL